MSNRRERNMRKAKRRRDKLLLACNKLTSEGLTITARLFDHDQAIGVTAWRTADDFRVFASVRRERLWRRMDAVPQLLFDRLLFMMRHRPVGN